jgi:hypothetical protein
MSSDSRFQHYLKEILPVINEHDGIEELNIEAKRDLDVFLSYKDSVKHMIGDVNDLLYLENIRNGMRPVSVSCLDESSTTSTTTITQYRNILEEHLLRGEAQAFMSTADREDARARILHQRSLLEEAYKAANKILVVPNEETVIAKLSLADITYSEAGEMLQDFVTCHQKPLYARESYPKRGITLAQSMPVRWPQSLMRFQFRSEQSAFDNSSTVVMTLRINERWDKIDGVWEYKSDDLKWEVQM